MLICLNWHVSTHLNIGRRSSITMIATLGRAGFGGRVARAITKPMEIIDTLTTRLIYFYVLVRNFICPLFGRSSEVRATQPTAGELCVCFFLYCGIRKQEMCSTDDPHRRLNEGSVMQPPGCGR